MNKLICHVNRHSSYRSFESVNILGAKCFGYRVLPQPTSLKLESKYQLTLNSKSLLPTGMTVPLGTSLCVFPVTIGTEAEMLDVLDSPKWGIYST